MNIQPFGHAGPPTPAITIKAETVHEGRLLFNGNCAGCHGLNAVAGPLPDLRYASKPVHDQFEEIVLRGTRKSYGMPSFGDILTAEQVRAIQAFVLSRAADSSKPSSN